MVRRFEDIPPDEQLRINQVRQDMLLAIGARLGAVALANIAALEGKPPSETSTLMKGVVTAGGGFVDIILFRHIYTSYFRTSTGFPWFMALGYAGMGALSTYGAQNFVAGQGDSAALWALLLPVLPALTFFASCDVALVKQVRFSSVDPDLALLSLKDIIVKAFRRQARPSPGLAPPCPNSGRSASRGSEGRLANVDSDESIVDQSIMSVAISG